MARLTLTYKGRDNWDRPVYECEGNLYVDVDPRGGHKPGICTKTGNDFYGEPDIPISANTEISFVPRRDTW